MDNFDSEIKTLLDGTFQMGSLMPSPYTADQLKIAIVVTNLKALVNTLLTADSNAEIQINMKQVALGILGTVDFLEESLPSLDEESTQENL